VANWPHLLLCPDGVRMAPPCALSQCVLAQLSTHGFEVPRRSCRTRYLSYVSACFDRYSWELVDCPWDPNAPIDYGQECAGELIIKQGTAVGASLLLLAGL